VATVREHALKPVIEDLDKDFVVDIAGTGQDGFNVFNNVNTAAGIVGAGASASARVIRICHAVISITCVDVKN